MSETEIGGRAKGETPLAYAYFQIYRDLGPEYRSLEKASEQEVRGRKSALRSLKRWSADYNWQKRVAEWDREQWRLAVRRASKQRQEDIDRLIKGRLELAGVEEGLYRRLLRDFIENGLDTLRWRQGSLAYNTSWEAIKELIGFMDAEAERVFNGYAQDDNS